MSDGLSTIDLSEPLQGWVEEAAGARVVSATRHFAGASREAWNVDVEVGGRIRALFLLKDKGEGGGSARDAGVLRALAGTPVPVPEVVGLSSVRSAILLERVPGRSDFPEVDRDSEREPIARHLMELTGRLHALDIEELSIAHLEPPKGPEDCARTSLEQVRDACRVLGDAADPFFLFALDWLESHVPRSCTRYALVHSDMGPGNFLYEAGRVTGIVDWEVAHFGDPMEDLAAIAVRDMAAPIGHLPTRFQEYESASGNLVDLGRIHYYRALVLVRNSLMIGLGLAHPAEGVDVVEMTMYQTLLMRAAALVVCDNLGVARPTVETSLPPLGVGGVQAVEVSSMRGTLLASIRRDFARTLAPAIQGTTAERACASIERAVETIEHEDRVGSALDAHERAELAELLGHDLDGASGDLLSLEAALRRDLHKLGREKQARSRAACYFARRFHRMAERRRPLMRELLERFPQPLEDA